MKRKLQHWGIYFNQNNFMMSCMDWWIKQARNTYYIYHIIDVTVLFDSVRCHRQCMIIETELILSQDHKSSAKLFKNLKNVSKQILKLYKYIRIFFTLWNSKKIVWIDYMFLFWEYHIHEKLVSSLNNWIFIALLYKTHPLLQCCKYFRKYLLQNKMNH